LFSAFSGLRRVVVRFRLLATGTTVTAFAMAFLLPRAPRFCPDSGAAIVTGISALPMTDPGSVSELPLTATGISAVPTVWPSSGVFCTVTGMTAFVAP
jgi:hypothetical protein